MARLDCSEASDSDPGRTIGSEASDSEQGRTIGSEAGDSEHRRSKEELIKTLNLLKQMLNVGFITGNNQGLLNIT